MAALVLRAMRVMCLVKYYYEIHEAWGGWLGFSLGREAGYNT
jgi:hypothetical protein